MSTAQIYHATGTASNAQLLALGTGANAITLIPAQGAGTMIRPLRVSLFLHAGAASTGLSVAGGGTLNCGFTPSQTNVLFGDTTSTYATAPDALITGWAEPLLSAGLFSAMTASTYNLVDCLVASMASANGAIAAGSATAVNKALELSISAGTISNRSGNAVTLGWDITYEVLNVPLG